MPRTTSTHSYWILWALRDVSISNLGGKYNQRRFDSNGLGRDRYRILGLVSGPIPSPSPGGRLHLYLVVGGIPWGCGVGIGEQCLFQLHDAQQGLEEAGQGVRAKRVQWMRHSDNAHLARGRVGEVTVDAEGCLDTPSSKSASLGWEGALPEPLGPRNEPNLRGPRSRWVGVGRRSHPGQAGFLKNWNVQKSGLGRHRFSQEALDTLKRLGGEQCGRAGKD